MKVSKTMVRALSIGVAAIALTLALTGAPAQANTPSDWSHGVGHSSTVGWTHDHAWLIASYADAIDYGVSFLVGQLCGIVSSEGGASQICSNAARQILTSLTSGSARLNNHGVWMAWYLWPAHSTSGTW